MHLNKSARLQRLVHLLYRNPLGLSSRELARLCGVTTRTVQRDVNDLCDAGIPVWSEPASGRHGIESGYYLPPIHFDLQEAGALYLAARLLARYSDEYNPTIVQALAKMAGAMPDSIAAHIHQTIRSLAYRPDNAGYARVLAVVLTGWATGRQVRIWHRSADEQVHDTLLSPYFLEPSSVGYATYAIGHSSRHAEVRTFKLERVAKAELSGESFEMPEGFDGAALLANAWGVMFGPVGEETEVVLQFSPAVTRRVKESIWHPSQVLEESAEGGCRLWLRLAMPLECKPWIRAWGPDCQVVAPGWLRAEIADELRRAADAYLRP
jgi:predicted DNA-binding transcriptional regulator YafY